MAPKPRKSEKWKDSIHIHPKDDCEPPCPFHAPSNHHMKDWPINIRFDMGCLVERICPCHGIGHPDPDSLAYLDPDGEKSLGIHGCAIPSCCRQPETEES